MKQRTENGSAPIARGSSARDRGIPRSAGPISIIIDLEAERNIASMHSDPPIVY